MSAELTGIALFGEKSRAVTTFYRELFDWPRHEPVVFVERTTAGRGGLELVACPDFGLGDGAAFLVQVDGIDKYAAKIPGLGGHVLAPPAVRPELGDAVVCVAQDPSGHRLVLLDYFPPFLERYAGRPRLVEYPPFDAGVLEAISLIESRFDRVLTPDEAGRARWHEVENARCWSEYLPLEPLLDRAGRPARVLEIGPGLGRWASFLARARGWHDVAFDLYDGEGRAPKYTYAGPRFEDSYCSTFSVLRDVLRQNGVANHRIVDARATPLSRLEGPYDLIFSFWSVGWHWSLDHFLADLAPAIGRSKLAVFTVPPDYEPPPGAGLRARRLAFEDPSGLPRHFLLFEGG